MSQSAHNARFVTLAVTTALATSALAGCTTSAAPRADLSAGKAQTALAKGQPDKALTHAEAAVLAEPRDASYRAMLGASYMEAGRFQSAATSFGDAMALGDTGARTALSLSLAQIASGDVRSARALLDNYRDDIDAADLGLAMALAGDANQGVHILSNAIRGGQNNAKTRQNLAYA
jgi:Flp pilus assembly protein TadD